MAATNAGIHTISALTACLSLVILGLVAHGVSLKDRLEYSATLDLKSTGMSFLFWPACGGMVDCCLFLFLWLRAPLHTTQSKKKTVYLNALVFVASFYFMRPLIVLIYTFTEHDVEAWACLLSNHGRNNTADSLCKELRASRYLLVPLFVLGVVFLSLVVWSRFGAWRGNKVSSKNSSGGSKPATVDAHV